MTRGLPLFLIVCVLAVAPYAFPALGMWPMLGLLVLMALTPATNPGRRRGHLKGERGSCDSP